MTARVHVVEPGGFGGIHQHAEALAAALVQAGASVVVHTAADAEHVPLPLPVPRRACFWRFASLRPRALRQAAVGAAWLTAGVPGILLRARPGDIVHVEGRFIPPLLLPLVAGTRLRRCTVGFSPHTTFPRPGRERHEPFVRWIARRADVVFAFSDHDRRAIEGWGVAPRPAALAVGTAGVETDPRLVDAWRRRWGAGDHGRRIVLFAGQIRHDKGLDLAVAAASRWQPDAVLAVVGEDLGALDEAVRMASALGVEFAVDEGFQPLSQFVAAVAAADVVICPYRVASQSGVLALAAALGRPTVATEVGGLPELATISVPADPDALATAVDKALAMPPGKPHRRDPMDIARPYLSAYGLAGDP